MRQTFDEENNVIDNPDFRFELDGLCVIPCPCMLHNILHRIGTKQLYIFRNWFIV